MDEKNRNLYGSQFNGEPEEDLLHGSGSRDVPDEDLPDLPSRYDGFDAAEPDADDAYAERRAPADGALTDAEREDYLHPDVDLDEYLSYSEYEEREEKAAEPAPRREQAPESAKKKGGLFSFMKRFAPSSAGKDAEDVKKPLPDTAGSPDFYPDSDPAEDLPPDTEEVEDTSEEAEDSGQLYVVHGGSRGRAEQEAREMIAELQAKSGAVPRRDRRTAADYRVELNDLLDMKAEDAPAAPNEPAPAGDEEYAFDLDQALDYDADVKQYRGKNEAPAYTPDAAEPEIDGRFNLGGQSPQATISYGENEVDLSADEDYVPAPQTEYNPSQWTPDYDDPLAERHDTAEPPRKKHRSLFGKARRGTADPPREEAARVPEEAAADAEITDDKAGPAVYAAGGEYHDEPDYVAAPDSIDNTDYDDEEFDEYEADDSSRKYRESDMYAPPTFREYLLSILASVWLKARGTVRGRTVETMRDVEEDLGPELSPAEASKYYGSFLRSMRYRLRISAGVLAVLLYISLEMPVPGMIQSLPVAAAFCFGMQAVILLLALDVVTNGLTNAFRLQFGADSLALVSCLFTGIDALIVALYDGAALHMPLCALSSASVVGLLLGSYLSARGLRKATRVPAIGKHFFVVTGENTLEKDEITLLKSTRSVRGFVRRTEEAGPDEALFARLAPMLFGLSLILALIVTIVKKSYPELIYILSAHLALTVPFAAMLSFSLPFFLGSSRIFRFGAAIAGWSGLCDVGTSKNLLVTDRDLFPESAVSIESVRIFADEDAQKVISYAGSMMQASGCCAAGCFGELMRETDSPALQIDGFEVMPGGGLKGVIEGHVVLCGSTDLMRLMNVRIPFRLTDKTTVLLAIDGILYGIFALKYEGQDQIRKALSDLMRTSHPPVFAVRDFNINPEMLRSTFDLSTDGYDFPPYAERFRLSEPTDDVKDERITAILCNEGLAPLTSVADIGRSMYYAININLVLNLIAAFSGVALVFFRFLSSGANSLATLFLYMLVWVLPVLAVSFFISVKR